MLLFGQTDRQLDRKKKENNMDHSYLWPELLMQERAFLCNSGDLLLLLRLQLEEFLLNVVDQQRRNHFSMSFHSNLKYNSLLQPLLSATNASTTVTKAARKQTNNKKQKKRERRDGRRTERMGAKNEGKKGKKNERKRERKKGRKEMRKFHLDHLGPELMTHERALLHDLDDSLLLLIL